MQKFTNLKDDINMMDFTSQLSHSLETKMCSSYNIH